MEVVHAPRRLPALQGAGSRFVALLLAYRKGWRIRVKDRRAQRVTANLVVQHTRPKRGETSRVKLLFSPKKRSFVVLPFVSGVDVPNEYPPCPSLRNQPPAVQSLVNRKR